MAERDQPPPPVVDPSVRRRSARHRGERPRAHHDTDRPLRDPGLAHGRDPSRRRRRFTPHGSLATRRRHGPIVEQRSRPPHQRRHDVDPAPDRCSAGLRKRRRRHRTDLVARHGRPSEPHVRSAARPHLGDALLAPAGARHAGTRRRRIRRCRRRHGTLGDAYREWLTKTHPGPGPGNLRRPMWYARPLKPRATAYLYLRANPDPASVES